MWDIQTRVVCCAFRREERPAQVALDANQRNLRTMENSRTDRLRRFGEQMPALLAAIEEADQRGRFKHRPRGPLGKAPFVCGDAVGVQLG